MTDETDDLDRHLASLFEKGRRREDPENHPSPEELSAYHANELPPEKADEIQEHLAQCRICAGLLLDLERFLEPGEERPQEGMADFGAEAGWRELQGRLGGVLADQAPDAQSVQVARLRRSLRRFQSLAALLCLAVVGLTLYSVSSRRENDERRMPEANAPMVYLPPLGKDRAWDRPKVVELSKEKKTRIFFSLVVSPKTASFPQYRLRLLRKGGEEILLLDNLRRQDDEFSFSMSSEDLTPGAYEIRIEGLRDGRPTLVGSYDVVVRRGSPAGSPKPP